MNKGINTKFSLLLLFLGYLTVMKLLKIPGYKSTDEAGRLMKSKGYG